MQADTVNNILRKFEKLWPGSFFLFALLVTESAHFPVILYQIKVARSKTLANWQICITVVAHIFCAVLDNCYQEALLELFSIFFTTTFVDYPETLNQVSSNACLTDL